MNSEHFKLAFAALEWIQAAPGARFKAVERDGKRIRLVEFTREFVEADWCRKGHIGVLLSGELEIDFSGRVLRYEPGDGLYIPPREEGKHKARALSESAVLFLVEDA